MAIRLGLIILLVIEIIFAACERSKELPPFGRLMREEFFMDSDFIQLNHGSYGTYPKVVSQALQEYQIRSERNPDRWLRRDVKTELAKVRSLLGELIGTDSGDIVMIPNVTTGINAIFRSIVFAFGERILHLSTVYASMGSLVQYIVDYSNGAVSKLVFNVTFPMTNSEFLQKLETFLEEMADPEQPIRIAIIEHIISVPAVRLPIEEIIRMLKRRNITVIIDGAHAIGQVPINITTLDPDYYVTDCHKWLYAARGCALLYVKKNLQRSIHPASINDGYKRPSDFQTEFFWTGYLRFNPGTIDYSSYMTVPAALEFRQRAGGEDAIMQYNHNLAYEGGNLMASRFGTRILQQGRDQMGSMVDVQLPVQKLDDPRISVSWWIDVQLNKHPNTFSPVHKHNGQWWVRVSAQIYNDISDFEASAQHFLDICNNDLNILVNSTAQ